MILINLGFVFLFALLLSFTLSWGFGWRHPAHSEAVGTSALFLFLVLVFAMWAGSAWLPPCGPIWYGTAWLTLLLVGLLVSLLMLAVATPVRRPRSRREATQQVDKVLAVGTAFGIFFWLLVLGLLATTVIRYLI